MARTLRRFHPIAKRTHGPVDRPARKFRACLQPKPEFPTTTSRQAEPYDKTVPRPMAAGPSLHLNLNGCFLEAAPPLPA